MKTTKHIALFAALALATTVGCKKDDQDNPADKDNDDNKTPDNDGKETPDTNDGKTPDGDNGDNGEAGASHGDHMVHLDPGAKEPAPVTRAVAIIAPTEGNKATGKVWFEKADKGVTIKTEMEGLPPGKHAYHVHIYGDCSGADGKTAGTHFHFTGPSVEPPSDIKIITGDLGNLEAGKDGKATHEATIETGALQGKFSIIGRAVIVHEKPNDPKSPPIGAAGGRLGCGVIGIAK